MKLTYFLKIFHPLGLSIRWREFLQLCSDYKEICIKKIALFAFNGEPMCFVHVLLNALDMKEKGYDIKVTIEGSATKLVEDLIDETKPFANLYKKVKEQGLIDCICKACANKMNSLHSAIEQQLPLCDELSGHPSMVKYLEQGFEIITF